MDHPSGSGRQGLFQFNSLPPEVRCRIYYFAIVEPHPLRLIARYVIGLNGGVQIFGVEKDLRMLETNREIRTEMKRMLYSGNSFWSSVSRDDLEEGTKLFKVDLSQIEEFYFWIDNMSNPEMDNEPYPDVGEFQQRFELLFLKGHRMKYLLIECERQPCHQLAEGLAPLSMQRNIRLVHFRSCQAKIYRFFRFLEGLMMSDQPIPPFNSHENFWEESRYDDDLLTHLDKAWFVDGLDTTTTVVDKSEE